MKLVHSEETMHKVYRALQRAGLSEDQVVDAVNDMMNHGIVFREFTLSEHVVE